MGPGPVAFHVDDLISYFFQHPFLVLQIITSQPAWLSSIQEPFLHLKKCSVPRMRRVPMSLELPLGIQGDWTWFCGKFIPQQLYHIYIIYFLLEKSKDFDCYFGWLEGNEESTPKCSVA